MNVAQFLRSLFSRPVACTFIAMLAIVAGVAGWSSATRVYESTTVVVVVPPGGGNPDAMLNPLINLNTNLAQLAAVVATVLRTDGQQTAFAAGGTGDFTVDTTFGDSPQFAQLTSQLVIVARGDNPESAQRSAEALVDFARASLVKVQADSWVPTRNNALIVSSVAPQAGSEVPTNPIRRGAAYAFGTILAGVILLLLYEALSERIRSRNQRARGKSRRARKGNRRARPVPPGQPIPQWQAAGDEDDDATGAIKSLQPGNSSANSTRSSR